VTVNGSSSWVQVGLRKVAICIAIIATIVNISNTSTCTHDLQQR
jgi:hypothetical protein